MAKKDDESPDVNDRLLALLERQQATMQESVERSRPKENPHYKAQSIFLQEDGEPWAAKLKCDIYFGPIRLNRTPLTKAEVDALNKLEPIEKGWITRVDDSRAQVKVIAREDAVGRVERLTIQLPMKKDDSPMHYPSLTVLAESLAAQAAQVAA